jgi:hypothetical protein
VIYQHLRRGYARVSGRKMVITRRTKVRQDWMLDALTRACDGVPIGRDEVKRGRLQQSSAILSGVYLLLYEQDTLFFNFASSQ